MIYVVLFGDMGGRFDMINVRLIDGFDLFWFRFVLLCAENMNRERITGMINCEF